MKVKKAMHEGVQWVEPMTSVKEIARLMRNCRDEEELDDAARIMEHKKIRRLPVINKDKRMIGMLSLGDVSQAGSRELTGEVMKSVSTHHGSTKKKSKRKA